MIKDFAYRYLPDDFKNMLFRNRVSNELEYKQQRITKMSHRIMRLSKMINKMDLERKALEYQVRIVQFEMQFLK